MIEPAPRSERSAPFGPKIFTPPSDATADVSPALTLPQFFELWSVQGRLLHADPMTLKQYRESLRFWARFTGNPPVSQINRHTLRDCIIGLKTLPGRSRKPGTIADNTVRKHLTHLQAVIDDAGPPSRSHPDAAGLTDEILVFRKPPLARNQHIKSFELAEIGSILDACLTAAPPHRQFRVREGVWWESLDTVAYNTGLRIETLLLLRFSWLEQNQWGFWFRVPHGAIKRDGWMFFVNRFALATIERMRSQSLAREDDLVFQWPYKPGWLFRTHKRIVQAAGLPPARQFGFHGLRRAFATELSRLNPAVAKMALGHAGEVILDYYTHMKLWAEVAEQLPQPPRHAADRQLSLF